MHFTQLLSRPHLEAPRIQNDVLKRLILYCSYFLQPQQMATKGGSKKGCLGSPAFDPDERVHDAAAREEALDHLRKDGFRDAITSWFKLPTGDKYVYHAITSVLLAQVQDFVDKGRANGLHDWYRNEAGEVVSLSLLITHTPLAIANVSTSFRRLHSKT